MHLVHLIFTYILVIELYWITPGITHSNTNFVIPGLFEVISAPNFPFFVSFDWNTKIMQEQSKLGQIPYNTLKEQYDNLDGSYRAAVKRLNCLSHIPQIIADKEYEARQSKERASNYENQYHEIHRMYANLVHSVSTQGVCSNCRLGQSRSVVERGCDVADTSQKVEASRIHPSEVVQPKKSDLRHVLSEPSTSTHVLSEDVDGSKSRGELYRGKLQVDCAPAFVPPSRIVFNDDMPHIPLFLPKDNVRRSLSSSKAQLPSEDLSAGSVTRSHSVPEKSTAHHSQDTPSPIPEVSKKNFDRLATEYTRMKHAVLKMEKEKDVDMKQYLEVLEYEQVIAGLREDLQYTKLQLDELRYINSAVVKKDTARIVQKCQDLQKKVAVLERSSKTKQEMIDRCVDIIKKLRAEQTQGTQLATAAVQSQAAGQLRDQFHAARSEPNLVTSEAVRANSKEIAELTAQLTNVTSQLEQERQLCNSKVTALELEVSELQVTLATTQEDKITMQDSYMELLASHEKLLSTQMSPDVESTESSRQFIQENKKLKEKNEILTHDLKKTLEEKQFLLLQCQIFKEDFDKCHHDFENNKKQLNQLLEQDKNLETLSVECKSCDPHKHQIMVEDINRLRAEVQKYRIQIPFDIRDHGRSLPSRYASSGYGSAPSDCGSSHSSTAETRGAMSAIDTTHDDQVVQVEYTCRRCEAVFKLFEKDRYEDHIRKCVD